MPRGAAQTEEVFGPYESFLDSMIWPSIRDGRQEPELKDVEDLAPQHAVAAFLKLRRWARNEPTGQLATIDDVDLRDEEAMTSVLGRHLAARALGLSEPSLHAVYGELNAGPGVDPHVVAAELVVAMGERFPEWALKDRIELGTYLAGKLDTRFLIKERSKA